MTNFKKVDGTPFSPNDTCRGVDHIVQSFTVTIRSNNFVTIEDVKNLLQSKFEVADIQKNDSTIYVS